MFSLTHESAGSFTAPAELRPAPPAGSLPQASSRRTTGQDDGAGLLAWAHLAAATLSIVRDPGQMPIVGMVGGGQLARMTQQAAIALGVTLRVLSQSAGDSAARVCADVRV